MTARAVGIGQRECGRETVRESVCRGGDGGVAATPRGMTHDRDNGLQVIVGRDLEVRPAHDPERVAFEQQLVPTSDPNDRAHLVRDGLGRLVPARDVPGAQRARVRPRLYPRGQMVTTETGAYSIDSACEWLGGKQAELAREGIDLGLGRTGGPSHQEQALRTLDAKLESRLRDRLERRVVVQMTPAEAALERAASRMLGGR